MVMTEPNYMLPLRELQNVIALDRLTTASAEVNETYRLREQALRAVAETAGAMDARKMSLEAGLDVMVALRDGLPPEPRLGELREALAVYDGVRALYR